MKIREFVRTICTHCGHCSIEWLREQDENFCLNQYNKNSKTFITHTYKKLRQFKIWPVIVNLEKDMFIEVFCKSETCGVINRKGCSCLENCLATYIDQTLSIGSLDTLDIIEDINKTTMIYGGSKQWIKQIQKLG